MNSIILLHRIKSVSVIIALITTAFAGILVFEGIVDTGGVDAATVRYVGVDSTYKTISEAILPSFPGDVIYVKNGTYFENVVVNRAGITLIGNSTANTIINGNGAGDVMRITRNFVNVSGFTLVNSGSSDPPTFDAGIELKDVNNVTIDNVNCSFNRAGVYLDNSHFNKITNSSFYANGILGFIAEFSNDNIILNNTSINNFDSGIYLSSSDDNVLEDNIVNRNGRYGIWFSQFNSFNDVINNDCYYNNLSGIYLRYSDNNNVESNICGYNGFSAIEVGASNSNTLTTNIGVSTHGWGITILSSLNNVLSGNSLYVCGILVDGTSAGHWNSHTIDTLNMVNDRPIYYWKFQSGGTIPADAGQVIVVNSTNVIVENQDIIHSPAAVEIGYSSSIIIRNNNLSNNVVGLLMFRTSSSSIENNTCGLNLQGGMRFVYTEGSTVRDSAIDSNFAPGMNFVLSNNNTITENSISNNDETGIDLYFSDANIFSNNEISSNNEKGAFINFSFRNSFFYNNISGNDPIGIDILDSNNNKIYFNNFIGNTVQAAEDTSSANSWDNSAGEGNFWSDYAGLDNGVGGRNIGDGIGDTLIAHLGLDNYPFVNNSGWLYPGKPVLYDPGDLDTDGNYTVSWPKNRGTINYRLEEDQDASFTSPVVVYDGSDLFINMTERSNGTYYYRLKAFSENYESSYSNVVDLTVDWFPAVPQNFKISSYAGGDALNLSWDVNIVDTKKYEIYSNASGSWIEVISVNHPGFEFDHTDLTDGMRYFYKIRSVDQMDQFSEFSAVLSGVPQDMMAPDPPSGIAIRSITYSSITIEWNNNTEADVQGYRIYRGNISDPSSWGDLIGTTGSGETNFTDTGLTELTTYRYRVTAIDEVILESDLSGEASATTRLGPHAPSVNNTYLDLIGDVVVTEDSYNDDKLDLTRLFSDVNNDALEFNVSGLEQIGITIYQDNGTVVIQPKHDWNGQETLTFYASDGFYEIEVNITITITGVNDPPGPVAVVSPSPGIETTDSSGIYFEAESDDPDLTYGDNLTYTWSSSVSGLIGTGANITDIDLPAGVHIITVEVSDSEGLISKAVINMTVLEKKEISDDRAGILIPLVVIIIIIIIFIILILFIRKRKRPDDEKVEADIGSEPPVVSVDIFPPGTEPQAEQCELTPVEVLPPGEQVLTGEPTAASAQPTPSMAPAPADQQYYPELPAGAGASATATDEIAPFIDHTQYMEWGRAYLIVTKESSFSIDIFEKFLEKEIGWGLCITRTHPDQLKSSMIMDGVKKIWLSQTAEEFSVSPSNLTKIAHMISEFMKTNDKPVIILDGLEYLLNNNEFQKVLKFLESVHEKIVLSKAVLVIPINPSALSKQDYEIMEKELGNTIKDPYYIDE